MSLGGWKIAFHRKKWGQTAEFEAKMEVSQVIILFWGGDPSHEINHPAISLDPQAMSKTRCPCHRLVPERLGNP